MKNKIIAHSFIVVALGTMLSGCASIMSGTTEEVTFQSTPDGATVTVNGRVIGKTPITTCLKKESGQTIVFEKDGFKKASLRLETRIDGWFWGNIVTGGFIGSTTDGLSGAVHEYSPSQYFVPLQALGTNAIENGSLSPEDRVREFVTLNYDKIGNELTAGAGENLSALLKLLQVADDKRAESINKMKGWYKDAKLAATFAGVLIYNFLKPPQQVGG